MVTFSPVTLGQTIASARIGGFVFTDTVHGPNLHLRRHAHENAAVSIVLTGACAQNTGREILACTPEAALLEPPALVHETRYENAWTRTFILEIPSSHRFFCNPLRLFGRYRLLRTPAIVESLHDLAREFQSARLDDTAYLLAAAQDVLANIHCDLPRLDGSRVAREARDFVLERYATGLRLDALAAAVDRHPMHVCKVFRREYGISIGGFARSLQVRHAIRELRAEEELPLSAVALSAGFSDQSHFTRVFKLYVGLTPHAYRAASRKKHTPCVDRSRLAGGRRR
jgi:AraC family transcriptional regulator